MVEFRTDYRPSDIELNALNAQAWAHEHVDQAYGAILDRSLGYVCAFSDSKMIGFVNIAWDGGVHAFILDTCVAPKYRRRGVALQMVKIAIDVARDRGAQWLHVDFEPHLQSFYDACGFRSTKAGLMRLSGE